jgi:hypothetical protein
LFFQPVAAKQAADRDRIAMSVEVANYIHDPYGVGSHPNAFGGSSKIEIGSAAIEWPYALADWRSTDGKYRGQIAFWYMCDHWNVGPITIGRRMSPKELVAMRPGDKEPVPAALIAELQKLEARHVAFIQPAHPTKGC